MKEGDKTHRFYMNDQTGQAPEGLFADYFDFGADSENRTAVIAALLFLFIAVVAILGYLYS